MYIQVRSIDGKSRITVSTSKTSTIKELKTIVAEELDVPIERQRLFFRGKQLENDHTLFDYDINLNDVVQLMVKQNLLNDIKETPLKDKLNDNTSESVNGGTLEDKPETPTQVSDKNILLDEYYKVGDKVDCKAASGGWFEGQIKEIVSKTSSTSGNKSNYYRVRFLNYNEPDTDLEFKNIRPRARVLLSMQELKKGHVVLVNYNGNNPEEPGFWYTSCIRSVNVTRRPKLVVDIKVGRDDESELANCKIKFINHVFRLEEPKLISERTKADDEICQGAAIPHRDLGTHFCDVCKDSKEVMECRKCGCQKCHKKNDPDKTILCDECDDAYHIYCLTPPLEEVPADDDWYCPECKNDDSEIVKAGEKLKFSKRKSQMASKQNNKSRDWGKGMACVGRTTECTIVPSNHFGPIPGVEVGTTWKYRLQVSEAGVHRPHVAGIHGREAEGAYSIVLSGGYVDDVDSGDTFYYSGSGGRDLSGNKRTAEQSNDQTLTRNNLALARNCNAPLNTKEGATAKDWKKGLPVRVVRNYKLSKHSKYAPTDGNRYDGIYKVVKYYPEKGKSGFLVWRYIFRRDDPTPAPWTSEGKKFMAAHGLDTILIPEGYEEAEKAKKSLTSKKRSLPESDAGSDAGSSGENTPPKKKSKTVSYELPSKLKDLIEKDVKNAKLWESVLLTLDKGKQEFLTEIQNTFVCICCLELINKPVTTDCKHNFCKTCLARSFKSEVYNCAHCRFDLGKDYEMVVNDTLQSILSEIFPGYNSKR